MFSAELSGHLEIEELPCTRAKGAEYCDHLDVFLPEEEARDEAKTEKCHSESPTQVRILANPNPKPNQP